MPNLVLYLMRSVVILVCCATNLWVNTYLVYAQAGTQTEAISNAQDLGNAFFGGSPASVDSQGNLTVKSANGTQINLSPSDLAPGANSTSWSAISGAYGTNASMAQAGSNASAQLATGSSAPAQAYQTLTSVYKNSSSGVTFNPTDPMLTAANNALSNSNLLSTFGACSQTTTTTPTTTSYHLSNEQTCQILNTPVTNYTLYHQYSYPTAPFEIESGTATINSCGSGCVDLIVGQPVVGYYDLGAAHVGCSTFTVPVQLNVNFPGAITSASIYTINWDDRATLTLNGSQVWESNSSFWDPTTQGVYGCDLITSWNASPNIDVTSTFQAGGSLNVTMTIQVGGGGDGWTDIRVYFDPSALTGTDSWGPSQAYTAVTSPDAQCTVQNGNCVSMPPVDQYGCTGSVADGNYLCPNDMAPAPVPGVSPLCLEATATVNCAQFMIGQGSCWTDPQGQQQCLTSNGSVPNSCTSYQNNPTCVFMTQSCVEGAQGNSGACYVLEQQWDCGTNTTVASTQQTTSYNCVGPVQCMGSSCNTVTQNSPSTFGSAYAALQAMQGVQMDGNCTSGSNCTIFPGTAMQCKIAVGGIVNCCNQPVPTSLSTYLSLLLATHSFYTDSGALNLLPDGAPDLSLSGLENDVSSVWGQITNQTVAATGSGTASEGFVGQMESQITTGVKNWVASTFDVPSGVIDSLFDEVGTAFTIVGWIYSVYEIAMLLIQLIWSCEQNELTLDSERSTKQCHYVGAYCASSILGLCIQTEDSYCCFASPLSRILQEQIRPQLGISWGTAKNPNCGPLEVSQLAQVNWSEVNLSEWIAMLNVANLGTNSLTMSMTGLASTGLGALPAGSPTLPDAATTAVTNTTGGANPTTLLQTRTQTLFQQGH